MPTAPFLAPERDTGLKIGRAKGGGLNSYTIPGSSVPFASTTAFTSGRDYYGPLLVTSPIIVDQFACEVTVGASGNLRMGLYRADRDWQPIGVPLADSGSIAITVAVKTYTPTTPIFLSRGLYVTAFNHDTSSTMRVARAGPHACAFDSALGTNGTITGLYVARAYAAFPTPGTAWANTVLAASGFHHMIWVRVSTP